MESRASPPDWTGETPVAPEAIRKMLLPNLSKYLGLERVRGKSF
jgi:hypothetical protein